MMKIVMAGAVLLTAALMAAGSLGAQDVGPGMTEAIMALTGATDAENLDEELVERYEALAEHPLKINTASRQALVSSGLFDAYLAATLMEYRAEHGDILSLAELAQVDGFASVARALGPFVSFYSPRLPGSTDGRGGAEGSVMTRAGLQDGDWCWGMKGKVVAGERWQVAFAARSVYSDAEKFPPSACSFHAAVGGNRGSFVLGDYSTRFGQGLALWSGFTMSGLQGSASFSKRPSGLSPSWSFSGASHRGAAGEVSLGRFTLTGFAGFPGLRRRMEGGRDVPVSLSSGANAAWYLRKGQVSATVYCRTDTTFRRLEGAKASLDARFCLRGVDLFGEGAWDVRDAVPTGIGGGSVPLGDGLRVSGLCRYYPAAYDADGSGAARAWSKDSDEFGASLGLSGYGAELTADWAERPSDGRRQFKALASGSIPLSTGLTAKFRGILRLRTYDRKFRSDVRGDLCWTRGRFLANCRAEWVRCADSGWLGYAEAGYKDGTLTAWLRFMAFGADAWDDRIYAYEHDAPGNFTVQACYGRGYSVSLYGGWKQRFRTSALKAWLRASLVSYPWNAKRKPGRTGLKLQVQYEF